MISRSQIPPLLRLYSYIVLITVAVSGLKGDDYSRLRGKKGSPSPRVLHGPKNGLEDLSNQQQQYFNVCYDALLSDAVVDDGIISQNDFRDKLVFFCEEYTVPFHSNSNAQVQCPGNQFTSLPVQVQLIFSYAICPADEGVPAQMECLDGLDSLNGMGADFGYIVNSETMPRVQATVENLCFELFSFVFPPEPTNAPTETFAPSASPESKIVPVPPPVAATPAVPATPVPATAGGEDGEESATPSGTPPGGVDPINAEEGTGSDEDKLVATEPNEHLSTGSIAGIASAAAACLLLLILLTGRHKNRDEDNQKALEEVGLEGDESFMSEGTPDLKFLAGYSVDALADTGDKSSVSSSNKGRKRSINQFDPSGAAAIALGRRGEDSSSYSRSSGFNRSSKASGTSSVDQIVGAIDKANWDEVYKLASQLAEQEDLSTLSSVGKQNARRVATSVSQQPRAHLSEEDQERTRTLDELVDGGDWTGVAVTAALYAGESGSSRENSSAKRSFLDIVTGKRATSRIAAKVSYEEDSLGAMPSYATPFAASALGALTDDTKSGTTDEGRPYSHAQAASASKPAPPAGAFNPERLGDQRKLTNMRSDSSSTPSTPSTLGHLKDRIDEAVDSGDWDSVLLLSSEVEKNSTFQESYAAGPRTPVKSIGSGSPNQPLQQVSTFRGAKGDEATLDSAKAELNQAVYLGDWALVGFYANMIGEKRPSYGSNKSGQEVDSTPATMSESRALVPASRPRSIAPTRSVDTSDSEMSKRQTIEKLAKAGKWKGVSIMAGLYEMESRGSLHARDGEDENVASADAGDTSTQPWFNIFAASSKDSQEDGEPASCPKGWMGMINLSRSNDETPEKAKPTSPYDHKKVPPQLKKEEVHLRNVDAGSKAPVTTSVDNVSSQRTTELRDVHRVEGDISAAQLESTGLQQGETGPAGFKRVDSQNPNTLKGAKLLIPYWQKREVNLNGPPEDGDDKNE